MTNDRTRMLAQTVQKLLHRGATANVQRILTKTHSADIASLLAALNEEEMYEVFRLEPSEEARAEILSYLDSDLQKRLLERMSSEETSKLVNLMDSDDAADLLGQLPEDESKDIIENLEESTTVELMGYPEDTAGGIMSSDYAAFREDMTVEQVINALQSEEMENKVTFYIYVLNTSGHLVGVVSLKQLLLSKRNTTLKMLMHPNVISVKVDTDQEQVAKAVERYDFLSLPVVDESNTLVGVITVDDVIDVIRQEAEEDLLGMGQAGWGVHMPVHEHFLARLPWQLMAFLAGGICFGIIYNFRMSDSSPGAWALAGYIPLLLAVGGVVANQVGTVMVGALQTGKFIGGRLKLHLLREASLGVLFSAVYAAVVWSLGQWLLDGAIPVPQWACAMAYQVMAMTVLGLGLPLVMTRIKVDPTVATVPFLTALADVLGIVLLLAVIR